MSHISGSKYGKAKVAGGMFAENMHARRKRAMRFSATAAWAWDTDTGDVSLASEWRDILALPHGKRLGSTLDFLLERMRSADRALLRKKCFAIASGRVDTLDVAVRLRRLDNTWAWVLLRGKAVAQTKGGWVFTGVGIEVSRLRLDKRFFPASLNDTETTYQSLLEHSPNYIVRFDHELFPLYMNPAVSNFIDCPPKDLGAKKVAELGTDEDDLFFLQKHVDRVFASGEVVKERRSVVTVYGNLISEFTFWPEFDANGNVRSVIALLQDLTADVQREKETLANETRSAALYQLTQMNDAPEDEVVRFVVEKIAELTGSRFCHLHILPGSLGAEGYVVWSRRHMNLLGEEALAATDPVVLWEAFGVSLEGAAIAPLSCNTAALPHANSFFKDKLPISRYLCAPAVEDGKTMCLAAVYNKDSDYTEADMRQLETFINGAWLVLRRRRYIEELKKAKESAELANKVKDRFLANVSHELRTPLNGMLSMLQLLELSPLAPEQAEYAKSATATGQTLLRIISDILDYSKMESGKLELDCNPFDFKDNLVSAINLFMADAHKKGIKMSLKTAGEFPHMVNGDEGRVRQIIFNLVGNAMKFTEQGEVEVSCEACPSEESTANIRLSVSDTGIGIPAHMQNKVFEAFTQVDASNTRKHQGSGLGLGIVRSLTQLMGGSIQLRSLPGQGTHVECLLPFEVVPENFLADEEETGHGVEELMPSCPALNVLVAEDDTVSRFAMRLFLERLGHRPVCVSNGKEALEALRLFAFDCLISDVLMPELDGLEVTRCIRDGTADGVEPSQAVRDAVQAVVPQEERNAPLLSVRKDMPIVAVSAHAMKGDKEHFLEQGMDYYLSKPVKMKDLAAMLGRVYEARQKKRVSGSVNLTA